MTIPTPPRLAAINRIETVLKAIVGDAGVGALNYWYTPAAVLRKLINPSELKGWPTYMISSASGGGSKETGPNETEEDFMISIKCYVEDPEDTVTLLERCVADIRKAIDTDARSTAAGTLGALGVETRFEEPPDTDDGWLSAANLGFFDMRIRIRIAWRFGEL